MALTTHEKIRVEAGFQSRFIREEFRNSPNSVDSVFYVHSDDNIKFVPEFGTGNTVAGLSDIKVYLGLSGIYGVSQLTISEVDVEQGSVRLPMVLATGTSLVISYSSSAIPSRDVEDVRLQAESIVNQRLSLCYSLPLSPTPSAISSLASRLGAAFLLMRGYGAGARDTSNDGYELYKLIMGANIGLVSVGTDSESAPVGELGLICSPSYQLVDDLGNIIVRNDSDTISGAGAYVNGGRVIGRIYDVTEESWRFKDFQADVNTDQPGSGL